MDKQKMDAMALTIEKMLQSGLTPYKMAEALNTYPQTVNSIIFRYKLFYKPVSKVYTNDDVRNLVEEIYLQLKNASFKSDLMRTYPQSYIRATCFIKLDEYKEYSKYLGLILDDLNNTELTNTEISRKHDITSTYFDMLIVVLRYYDLYEPKKQLQYANLKALEDSKISYENFVNEIVLKIYNGDIKYLKVKPYINTLPIIRGHIEQYISYSKKQSIVKRCNTHKVIIARYHFIEDTLSKIINFFQYRVYKRLYKDFCEIYGAVFSERTFIKYCRLYIKNHYKEFAPSIFIQYYINLQIDRLQINIYNHSSDKEWLIGLYKKFYILETKYEIRLQDYIDKEVYEKYLPIKEHIAKKQKDLQEEQETAITRW